MIIDGSSSNVVAGDYIGTDSTGAARLGNAIDGVLIVNGASGNLVGGTTASAHDIISANGIDGVEIDGTGTSANVVAGDDIGTDLTGAKALGNTDAGVYLSAGASSNTVGGTTAGACDVISANGQNGVTIGNGCYINTVAGDNIGTDATGTKPLGNLAAGVALIDGASSNLIGGTSGAGGNLIAYNGSDGVDVLRAGATGNVIDYDTIESNVGSGIVISSAPGNGVFYCTIESNHGCGILMINSPTTLIGNLVAGNVQGEVIQE